MSEQEQIEMFKNAVQKPMSGLSAVEVDSLFRARKLIDIAKQEVGERPFATLQFSKTKTAALLLDEAIDAVKDWEAGQGTLFITDAEGTEEKIKIEFWKKMNVLRESWGYLECHVIFFLLPGTYLVMLRAADHLADWISLKLHIMGFSEHSDVTQSLNPQASVFSKSKMSPKTARHVLAALESQLAKAINKGMDQNALIRRYYLPMLEASIAITDFNRAQSLRKKISEIDIQESDLPDWWFMNYELDAKLRNLKQAQKWIEELLHWSGKNENTQWKTRAFFALGTIAKGTGDIDSAEKWCKKALEIHEKQKNENGIAYISWALGIIAQERNDLESAEPLYIKPLEIFEKQGDESGLAFTYNQLGNIAFKRRDFESAEQWYIKSLGIKEKQGDEDGAANTYHNMGLIYQEKNEFEAAEKWYRKSLEISEKQGNEYGVAMVYNLLSLLAGLQKHFEESGKHFIKAMLLFSKCNAPSKIEQTINNFKILYKQADPKTQTKLKTMWEESLPDYELEIDDHLKK